MFASIFLSFMFTVIHSSDGGVDDFVSSALIAAAQEKNTKTEHKSFNFPAIVLTTGDGIPLNSFEAYRKTIKLLNLSTRVALSSSRLWIQFPWAWRVKSEAITQLPILKGINVNQEGDANLYGGNALFTESLKKATRAKIIATGPMTTISDVLKANPELIKVISEIHWMGGAIDVQGNIIDSPEIPKYLLNDKAEWNVFADPEAVDWMFKHTTIPIYLYPLDISNMAIPGDFVKILSVKKQTIFSTFVQQCYKIVEQIEGYRMWDVVAAAGGIFPEVFDRPIKMKLRVEVSGKDVGALVRDPNGRELQVYMTFMNNDPNLFYETVANALAE